MNLGSRRLGAGCSTCGGVNRPTNQCDERKVVSISKAGDSLIIALDDCTFFKADMSVLDACVCGKEGEAGGNATDAEAIKSLKDSIAKLQEKVTALEAKEDKDTVFDPSALEARIAALENKADKDTVYDDTALAARVKALEDAPAGDRVDTTAFVRKSDLIDVANFAGTVRFKAYPADVGISNAGGGDASDHLL